MPSKPTLEHVFKGYDSSFFMDYESLFAPYTENLMFPQLLKPRNFGPFIGIDVARPGGDRVTNLLIHGMQGNDPEATEVICQAMKEGFKIARKRLTELADKRHREREIAKHELALTAYEKKEREYVLQHAPQMSLADPAGNVPGTPEFEAHIAKVEITAKAIFRTLNKPPVHPFPEPPPDEKLTVTEVLEVIGGNFLKALAAQGLGPNVEVNVVFEGQVISINTRSIGMTGNNGPGGDAGPEVPKDETRHCLTHGAFTETLCPSCVGNRTIPKA